MLVDGLPRAVILALTALALAFIIDHQPEAIPPPVRHDYCWINFPVANKDRFGAWHFGFAWGFGPCALLDRYQYI